MGATAEGLDGLIHDLKAAQAEALEATKRVLGRAGLNIKKDAQRIIRDAGHKGYLPHYPRAISYDVTAEGDVATVEIGPKKEKLQGGLGPYIENGTVNNAPIPHLSPALDNETPNAERYLERVGAQLLEGEPLPNEPVVDADA